MAVSAKHFTDLHCWQLSSELKRRVYDVLQRGSVRTDADYCDRLWRCASSAPRNIAEGFGKFNQCEFARFLRIARGSLVEVQDGILDGLDRGHVDQQECDDLTLLATRAVKATTALVRHLTETQDRRFWTLP